MKFFLKVLDSLVIILGFVLFVLITNKCGLILGIVSVVIYIIVMKYTSMENKPFKDKLNE